MASPYRLPQVVRPTRYDVDLTTSPSRSDFFGTVTMQLAVREHTDRIEMHAKHLELADAHLVRGETKTPLDFTLDDDQETVTFTAGAPIEAGDVALTVAFKGAPSPSMHGLYLAADGEERAVCTQCEATDARAIFPCFDEPEFKARLAWTIRTDAELVALANGPLIERTEEDGLSVWRFEATAPVSSYLAAIAVGDFAGTDETLAHDTPVRVWAMRGKQSQAKFAHAFTEKLIPYYEDYFGIDYPYVKYDQVAVPGFDAGAMENVGLVLFRQNLLLMGSSSASWNQEKLIAKVIAHELAHMWFGNLVTMKWWDDLWLNEAFAEWFAHKACDAAAPDYLVWYDFQSDKNRALVDDALPTTHPIWTAVETPDEAIEMFDVITYQKGCAVMRMLEDYLGEAPFRDGLRTYMAEYAESNARGADLWRHLEQASSQPVGALMKSWIEQPGFPIVDYDVEGATIVVKQKRFWSKPDAPADDGQTWNVPLVVRFADDEGIKDHRFILDGTQGRAELPAKGAIQWCFLNADGIGFYRTAPSERVVRQVLANAIEHLSPVEQMGFIEDQWALVRNGTQDIGAFMPVLEEFVASRDHNVVRSLADRFGSLEALLELAGEEEALAKMRTVIGERFAPHVAELSYAPKDGESQNDTQRRAIAIFSLASVARDADAIAECERYAEQERADPRSIDPNLTGTFVGIAAKFGDAARYDAWESTYVARRKGAAAPQESLRYLYTFAAFRPEALTARTLAHLDDGFIPQEAVGSIVSQLLGHRHSQLAAWAYVKANWATLQKRVGDMGISRVVESVGRLPGDQRADIVAFFEANPPKGAERALARALESLDQREELLKRVTPGLVAYLA